MKKVVWGVISTASIGMEKVLPAMQQSAWCDIRAIASRSLESARKAADKLGIERAYGSYYTAHLFCESTILLLLPDNKRNKRNGLTSGYSEFLVGFAKIILKCVDCYFQIRRNNFHWWLHKRILSSLCRLGALYWSNHNQLDV